MDYRLVFINGEPWGWMPWNPEETLTFRVLVEGVAVSENVLCTDWPMEMVDASSAHQRRIALDALRAGLPVTLETREADGTLYEDPGPDAPPNPMHLTPSDLPYLELPMEGTP